MSSIHRFRLPALESGKTLDFSAFKGKRILLVNVASECGLTPQYQQLQELYAQYGERIVVVGCPANNFGAQEPGTEAQIQAFCQTRYGVSFPMSAKISVKGEDMHELYQFVTQKALNGVEDSEVTWNFQKYVFDEQGQYLAMFSPRTEPADEAVLEALGL